MIKLLKKFLITQITHESIVPNNTSFLFKSFFISGTFSINLIVKRKRNVNKNTIKILKIIHK